MMFPQEKGICQQAANSSQKKKKKVLHDYLDLLSSLNFYQYIIWLPNHKVYCVIVISVTSFFFPLAFPGGCGKPRGLLGSVAAFWPFRFMSCLLGRPGWAPWNTSTARGEGRGTDASPPSAPVWGGPNRALFCAHILSVCWFYLFHICISLCVYFHQHSFLIIHHTSVPLGLF